LPKFVLMQPVSKPYAYESYLLIDTKLLIDSDDTIMTNCTFNL